ncbi:MAG: hypothetical protein RL094_510 [Candidatus Parcubacteria bacterium]
MMNNKKLAIVDVDGTLIRGQSQQHLIKFLLKKGLIGRWFFFRLNLWFVCYKLGLVHDIRTVLEYALSYFKDKDSQTIDQVLDAFIATSIKPRIYPKSHDLIKQLKADGYYVLLLSGAIEPIISRVSTIFQADAYVCTRVEVLEGKYTGKLANEVVYGENKVDMLKKFIEEHGFDIKQTRAYADHLSDIPLLLKVSEPFAANPSTAMKKIAEMNNIPVIYL